ncbi:MAG: thermonuclease family protein [Thermosipho sp. (in: Bacteria)]|nr:thermonuclease family protein [Thermosipho sp. (in: thermotogales)]
MRLKKYLLLIFALSFVLTSCINLNLFDSAYIYVDVVQYYQSLEHVEVSNIVDGDTFDINDGSRIRIIGIDTPEIHEGSKPVGEFGDVAKEYLEKFISKYDIYIIRKGYDTYGRVLAYVFGKLDDSTYNFYEGSILRAGLARPLIYFDNDDDYLTPKIVEAYNYAFEKKVGIFSKWFTAPVLKSLNDYNSSLHEGKIVFLEGYVQDVDYNNGEWYIDTSWFTIKIRAEEYEYFFNNYNLYNLRYKTVKFYGELWDDNGRLMILLRSPNEIVIL